MIQKEIIDYTIDDITETLTIYLNVGLLLSDVVINRNNISVYDLFTEVTHLVHNANNELLTKRYSNIKYIKIEMDSQLGLLYGIPLSISLKEN